VGNLPGAAVFESLLGPVELQIDSATTLAITGVATDVRISSAAGDRAADSETVLTLPAGCVVRLGRFTAGLRGYIAIRGGLADPPVLGSRSADTLGSLGPAPVLAGQAIITGHETTLFPDVNNASHHSRHGALSKGVAEVRLLPAPRSDMHRDLRQRLLDGRWRVNPDSDRVGIRLDRVPEDDDSEAVARVEHPSLVSGETVDLRTASQPLIRGAVQMPTVLNAVVMGPDHPTVGGYPVVGVVHETDQDQLAHLRPGDEVAFRGEPGEVSWLTRQRSQESPGDEIDWW